MKELVDLSHAIVRAIRDRDRASLEAILAPDFVHIGANGERTPREAFLAGIVAAPYRITEIAFDWIAVDELASSAVVSGVQRASVVLESGESVVARGEFTDVFLRTPDGWRLRYAHTVDLP